MHHRQSVCQHRLSSNAFFFRGLTLYKIHANMRHHQSIAHVSTQTNFHPDLPHELNRTKLGLGAEVDKLAAVAHELGLTEVTLVAHDWGSLFGYIFAAKYPQLIKKVVQFDIGGMVQFDPPQEWVRLYQHEIIAAWDAKSDLLLKPFAAGVPNAKMLYWQAAWPYVTLWNNGNDVNHWKHEAFPGIDPSAWGNWTFSPKPLTQPLLFFWGNCDTPSCSGPPRKDLFFNAQWVPYLNATNGDLSVEVHNNHWIYVYNKTGAIPGVIKAMKQWLQT